MNRSPRPPPPSDRGRRVGIPAGRLADLSIDALNLCSAQPRLWSDDDIAIARELADVATRYVAKASRSRQQEQLSEQMHEALESRVVIEQAEPPATTGAFTV